MPIWLDFCDSHAGTSAPGAGALRCRFDTPLDTLIAHTPEQVSALLEQVQDHAQQGRWCVGYLRYEAAAAFDRAFVIHAADGPLAWFGVFEAPLPWPTKPPDAPDGGTGDWSSRLSQSDFEHNIARIHTAIAAGELYQVNYTAPLQATLKGSAAALFERLQRAQPGGYSAHIDTGFEQILSVSPELFFDWRAPHLLTRPMKGTAARGATPALDRAQVQHLLDSPKERAENVMIVDLLRNDVSRVAQPHSVRVPALFRVQSLPTVHQMVSDVTAQTRPGTRLAEVFAALFPCGSITGAPKVRAMQMIHALEPEPRGVYCGAIGVVRPGGHATFSVAIRTVTMQGKHLRCGIGSGITADARAAAEWQEWQHKRGFLVRAACPFELLETLRLQDGVFVALPLHLARLKRAATHFGYRFDEARIREALNAAAPSGHARWRVRLRLSACGTPNVEFFELNEALTQVDIALAATFFKASDSEFTRFKTTRRAHYDTFAPTGPAVFDTLLYNARGELTECTRGNIAVLLDGQWRTPALHCGLLDGVGRAQALQAGKLVEAVITVADLQRAQGLAFVNSLRGWLDARLCAPPAPETAGVSTP